MSGLLFPRDIALHAGDYKTVHCSSCGQASFKVKSCMNLHYGFHIIFVCHYCRQTMTYIENKPDNSNEVV